MQFTLVQVIGIFIFFSIAWWAIKSLIAQYIISYLDKKRFCTKCLDHGKGKLVLDARWSVKTTDSVPLFLCDKCKNEEFPGDVGKFAKERGMLIEKNYE